MRSRTGILPENTDAQYTQLPRGPYTIRALRLAQHPPRRNAERTSSPQPKTNDRPDWSSNDATGARTNPPERGTTTDPRNPREPRFSVHPINLPPRGSMDEYDVTSLQSDVITQLTSDFDIDNGRPTRNEHHSADEDRRNWTYARHRESSLEKNGRTIVIRNITITH